MSIEMGLLSVRTDDGGSQMTHVHFLGDVWRREVHQHLQGLHWRRPQGARGIPGDAADGIENHGHGHADVDEPIRLKTIIKK